MESRSVFVLTLVPGDEDGGITGFPCCDKKSVNIVETQCNIIQDQSQEEDELELETELLALDSSSSACLDRDPEPDRRTTPRPEPQAEPDTGSSLQGGPKEPEPQVDRTESLQTSMEELRPQDACLWEVESSSTDLSGSGEGRLPTNHHSIHVQTSKHLFWADKLIQTSQESVEKAIRMHLDKKSLAAAPRRPDQARAPEDALSATKRLKSQSAQVLVPATEPQQPPSCSPPPGLSPAIGLAELVNLATSLAMASSNKNLPSLELRVQGASKKVRERPAELPMEGAAQPATDQTEQEKLAQALLEKPPEDRQMQKGWEQENKSFLYPYFDFNQPGVARTTFEGKVKLLQSPVLLAPPQETKPDSVPATKKGSPLLLKIHFKLSAPSPPEK
ncbi:PREDICTED: spermatogenesis-associated protein 32 [Condylura cristata]|uniref:spermatogenesis-associated protein 32 n=1 Tax=Condylura cristata TaxID=143302 RepID=UPI0003346BA5|nr:PREDICTED: spermatogenesis-associated protein 32 [Condylura cristata]